MSFSTKAGRGADVGTNLIDGHNRRGRRERGMAGADVGTNLIDGHSAASNRAEPGLRGADVGTNLIDGH